jgi:hypothetical protein
MRSHADDLDGLDFVKDLIHEAMLNIDLLISIFMLLSLIAYGKKTEKMINS